MDMGIFYACTGKKALTNGPSLLVFFNFFLARFWSLTETLLYCDCSFKAINKEFFFAASTGLFLWIGCPSSSAVQQADYFFRVTYRNICFGPFIDYGVSAGKCLWYNYPRNRNGSVERHCSLWLWLTSDIFKRVGFWILIQGDCCKYIPTDAEVTWPLNSEHEM